MILHCFLQANKPEGGSRSDDKDALQLDFEEFKVFIRVLGTRMGCVFKSEENQPKIVVKNVRMHAQDLSYAYMYTLFCFATRSIACIHVYSSLSRMSCTQIESVMKAQEPKSDVVVKSLRAPKCVLVRRLTASRSKSR